MHADAYTRSAHSATSRNKPRATSQLNARRGTKATPEAAAAALAAAGLLKLEEAPQVLGLDRPLASGSGSATTGKGGKPLTQAQLKAQQRQLTAQQKRAQQQQQEAMEDGSEDAEGEEYDDEDAEHESVYSADADAEPDVDVDVEMAAVEDGGRVKEQAPAAASSSKAQSGRASSHGESDNGTPSGPAPAQDKVTFEAALETLTKGSSGGSGSGSASGGNGHKATLDAAGKRQRKPSAKAAEAGMYGASGSETW